MSDIVLKHFSDKTFKIASKSIKLEAKVTLINTTSNLSNSKGNTSKKKELYLISCSLSKISKEDLEKKEFNLEKLSFHKELGKFSKDLFKIFELNKNHKGVKKVTKNKKTKIKSIKNELDLNKTVKAYKLYSKGKFYARSASDSLSWNLTNTKQIYIVSALFGIIRADDYIPFYNLAMTDEINGCKNFAQKHWKGKLDSIIENLINSNSHMYNLLSKNYKVCISEKIVQLLKPQEHLSISEIDINNRDRNNCLQKRGKFLKHKLDNNYNLIQPLTFIPKPP